MRARVAYLTLVVIWSFGVANLACRLTPDVVSEDQAAAIQVAVFDHQINGEEFTEFDQEVFFALGVYDASADGYKDPKESVIRTLTNLSPRVRAYSDCLVTLEKGAILRIEDPSTGDKGILLWVWTIDRAGRHEVVVQAGYTSGPLNSKGFEYRLRHRNSRWEVESAKVKWIS